MIVQRWEAIPFRNWNKEGLQVVMVTCDDIPDEAMRKGGNEWFDGTFQCLLDAIYFKSPKPFATLATTKFVSLLDSSWVSNPDGFSITIVWEDPHLQK